MAMDLCVETPRIVRGCRITDSRVVRLTQCIMQPDLDGPVIIVTTTDNILSVKCYPLYCVDSCLTYIMDI